MQIIVTLVLVVIALSLGLGLRYFKIDANNPAATKQIKLDLLLKPLWNQGPDTQTSIID